MTSINLLNCFFSIQEAAEAKDQMQKVMASKPRTKDLIGAAFAEVRWWKGLQRFTCMMYMVFECF